MLCPHCDAENPEGNRFCAECGKPIAPEAASLPPLTECPSYRPSGRCPSGALLLLAGATLGGSLVVGGVYHVVARFVNLLILFPLGAGILVGIALGTAVSRGKCRSPLLALLCGLIAAPLTYGTRLVLDSQHARPMLVQAMAEAIAEEEKVPAEQVVPEVEKALTPWPTFQLYMQIRAYHGTTISRAGRGSDSGIPIKGGVFWALVLVEVGLVALMAAMAARSAASEPFCEKCQEWCADTILFRAHPSQCDALVEKIRGQDWKGAGELPVGGEVDEKNHCDVMITRCGTCLATTLAVASTTKGKTRRVLSATLAPESVARLVKSGSAEEEPAEEDAAPVGA